MTRINLPPPSRLLDQHLMAEWRELPRIMPAARLALDRGNIASPARYTLGAGHVRFFYARTGWLAARHAALTAELLDRGYRLTDRPPLAAVPGCDVPWEPDAGDLAVSLDRLRNKLHNPPRPGFYTFRGAPVGLDFYDMEAA